MSTTQRLPMLTPWRTLHRMWVHFASKWELPTKIEQAITQTRKACERDFEERLRKWRRIWFDEGYQQAVKDLPICQVQPAPLALPPPLGIRARALNRQRLVAQPSAYDPPPHVLPPVLDDWINSAPSAFDQLLDVPTVHDLKAVREKHEGRGKAS